MGNSIFIVALFAIMTSCGANTSQGEKATPAKSLIATPAFDKDSAYTYVKIQTEFGPRVPGSEAHTQCADYLLNELMRHGAKAMIQEGKMTAYNGEPVAVRNIIGSYNPENKKRILLCAHWDSRPWADEDPNPANHKKPVLGADDGASGVGVLLEVARQLSLNQPTVGVDIIFFDTEDMGTPTFETRYNNEHSWCLGSQYWSRNKHERGYRAMYGILLDMVGGFNPTFLREGISEHFAPGVVNKVWDIARQLGYANLFLDVKGPMITDDHLYVNQIAKIPCINIINLSQTGNSSFVPYWHTVNDTMENISPQTLEAVGKVVLAVLYNE